MPIPSDYADLLKILNKHNEPLESKKKANRQRDAVDIDTLRSKLKMGRRKF